jgi:Ni/Fe-hydrogenase subunit HybB-like protein
MKDSLVFTSYMPSMIEIITAMGIVAIGLLLFTLGVKYLKIVDHNPKPSRSHSPAD